MYYEYLINAVLILNRIFVSEKGETLTIMMDSCVCATQKSHVYCWLDSSNLLVCNVEVTPGVHCCHGNFIFYQWHKT